MRGIPAAATSRCVFGGATRRKPRSIRTREHAHLPDEDLMTMSGRERSLTSGGNDQWAGETDGEDLPQRRACQANGTMEVVFMRGVDGTTAVVVVSPRLVTGPLDARAEARGGRATAESLRRSRSELGSCIQRGTRGRIHQRTRRILMSTPRRSGHVQFGVCR